MKRLLIIIIFFQGFTGICQSTREIAQDLGLGSAFSQGVSIVDINDDGFDDIFVTRRNRDNQFFINNGDATFTNIAESAGVDDIGISALTIWEDYDQDGDLDFFLGMEEDNSKLYVNNGDLTFTDITTLTIGTISGYVASAQWGDVNGDGWLDLFVFMLDGDNHYYFSDQKGGFNDLTDALGLVQKRLTMGAMLFDFDQDGDLDLYKTHDGYGGNHFYVNDGMGNFDDQSLDLGIYTETDAMGLSVGDFNNDGWEDIYLTNLYENQLFKNIDGKRFEEVAQNKGVDDYGMGWGASWLDFDNDGWLDLYIANDSYFSDHSNLLFHNQRGENFTKSFTGEEITSNKASYASAISDLNNNGIEELVITNRGSTDRLEIFEFVEPNENNWLSIKITDRHLAVGVVVTVSTDEMVQTRSFHSGTSWAAENSDWLKFGLGTKSEAQLDVLWPNGDKSEFSIDDVNQFYLVYPEKVEANVKSTYSFLPDVVTEIHKDIYKNINTYVYKYININILNYTKVNIYKYDGILIYAKKFDSIETLDLGFLERGVYILSLEEKGRVTRLKIYKD